MAPRKPQKVPPRPRGWKWEWPVDLGICREVKILFENGIETSESCQGGMGHCYPEPTVCFFGDFAEGYRAVTIALQHGLRVSELRRTWSIQNGQLVGPEWQIVFVEPVIFGGRKKLGRDGVYR